MPKAAHRAWLAGPLLALTMLGACGGEPSATLGPAPTLPARPTGPDKDRFCDLSEEFVLRIGDLDFGRRTKEDIKRVFRGIVDRTEATTQEAMVVAPPEIADDYRETIAAAVRVAETGDIAELRRPAFKNVIDYTDRECG